MVKVFSIGRRKEFDPIWLSASLVLILVMGWPVKAWSGYRPPLLGTAQLEGGAVLKVADPQAKTKSDSAKTESESAAAQPKEETKPQSEGTAAPPADPSQTRKVAALEILKEPKAEKLLDLKKFSEIRSRPLAAGDVEAVKRMAGDTTVPIDPNLIRRVVDAMAAQLSDHRNIQALIDPPANLNPNSTTARAIEEAAGILLEPLFLSRNAKNDAFQAEYNKALMRLAPLLKNHLVPRVQAMIVLGQSGSPELFKLYLDEIKNPEQTVWVKLWALRGIANIKHFSTSYRLSAAQEIEAAKVIADQLNKHKDLPWPVQLRALEALSVLRQGFVPSSPWNAEIADTAMRILSDHRARLEVRAESARAAGMMQITSAVPKYNFGLVAYAAGQLAAELGDQIVSTFPENRIKADYLTALLIGPVYQAFDGQPGMHDSGLLHGYTGNYRNDIQRIANQIKPVARAAVDLLNAPGGQVSAHRKDLSARVALLKDFLEKNTPADHHLVPGGPEYPPAEGEVADAPTEPGAAEVAGARRAN
jgi:hypothetical protein